MNAGGSTARGGSGNDAAGRPAGKPACEAEAGCHGRWQASLRNCRGQAEELRIQCPGSDALAAQLVPELQVREFPAHGSKWFSESALRTAGVAWRVFRGAAGCGVSWRAAGGAQRRFRAVDASTMWCSGTTGRRAWSRSCPVSQSGGAALDSVGVWLIEIGDDDACAACGRASAPVQGGVRNAPPRRLDPARRPCGFHAAGAMHRLSGAELEPHVRPLRPTGRRAG